MDEEYTERIARRDGTITIEGGAREIYVLKLQCGERREGEKREENNGLK